MTGLLSCRSCRYRIKLQDPYVSSKYCLLRKERIIDYIIAITSCAQFRQASQPASEKKVQNIEEAMRAINQNVKAFQVVCNNKEQGKLRKFFAVYRLSRLGFTTWEIAILLNQTEPKIRQHVSEAFKHSCLKEQSCWAKPFISNYI